MQNLFLRRVGDYIVRQSKIEDLNDVISVNLVSLPEHYTNFFFEELLRESPDTFLVAEGYDAIVGYIMCRIEYGFSQIKKFGLSRKGHIVSVAVLEKHSAKGLGSALVEEALKGMKQRNCSEAYLEVRTSNNIAIKLYENIGFKISSYLPAYYRDSEDAYLMTFQIN